VQTELIDLKNDPKYKIDVYDLEQKRKRTKGGKIGLKQTKEVKVGTDLNKKEMLSAQDWYFSDMHRHLLQGYYHRFKKKLPKEIQDEFKQFDFSRVQIDREQQKLDLAYPKKLSVDSGSQPDDLFAQPTKMICEPEITYLIGMLKTDVEKWNSP